MTACAGSARWDAATRLIATHRDVLDARPTFGDAPDALVARGWASFLLGLDEASLVSLEVRGHEGKWPDGAPPSLAAFLAEARDVCALSPHPPAPRDATALAARRGERPRKSAQIDAFARVVLPLAARATRVIDVGSGHGHLTRAIAERIALPVIGLERDVGLAARARTLSTRASPSFDVTDVVSDGLALAAGDCVVGLHACGELGDAIVQSAARVGASVALVGCCLQKRRAASRRALSAEPELALALDLPRAFLGLSNLTARDEGVEASRERNLAARERRLALHRLLARHDAALAVGAEMRGLNRRAAHGPLAPLAARAFALRGLPSPTREAVADAARWASHEHARARRLSLPRAIMARVLEVFVLLDRARYLARHGLEVRTFTLFPVEVSARNLVLVAQRGP